MKTNYQSITLLLISIITAGLAQGLTIIAIPWHFTDQLNLSSRFSLLYAIITFIGLFWGLYAGVIIDSVNRKKILLYSNWTGCLIFVSIGLVGFFLNNLNQFLFFFAFATCSFYYMIFFPNLYALAQELTNKKEYVKINSLIEIFFQTTSIISATICGLLLSDNQMIIEFFNVSVIGFEKWEIWEIFLLNGLLYASTSILLRYVKYDDHRIKLSTSILSAFQKIKTGIFFLAKNKDILIYGVCSQIIFAFLIVELFALLPLFVKNCLNENIITFSLADVIYAAGAIIAGLITIKILKYIDKILLTFILIIITGYAFFIMIKFHRLDVFFLTTLIIGLTNASTRITRMSYLFEKTPNYLMGRINTIFNSINTIIRCVLILIFSLPWFAYSKHVVIGYKIGIYILILFAIPLIFQIKKRLN
ncbi:MAG: hypothetical protein CMP62_01340 [Flavobacteriales bacterium]|nr:hypothetical protein [Flavobacteriales bacterium]|tara:strand:- start:6296 stop:7552 length:1257 start_codon:yes stop_codon:yes gene_type:complete